MPRYYEETALIEFVKQYTPHINGETTMECVERAIREAPTADVVPKSEVFLASSDAMKMLIECHGYALTHDADIKKEVAREIFDDIEGSIAVHAFTSKSEDYADGMYDAIEWVDSKIAELKKKYTEATDGTYEKSSHPADD